MRATYNSSRLVNVAKDDQSTDDMELYEASLEREKERE